MKTVLKITGGLIVLLVLAFIGFIATFDVNQYKDDIVRMVEEKTDRSFKVEGDLSLGISLIPTIKVEGVTFGNAKWGTQADMLSVGLFEAQIALFPLLSKNIQIKRLILNNTNIFLEKNKKGETNWTITVAETEQQKKPDNNGQTSALPGLDIKEIKINDATLTYMDAKSGRTEKIALQMFSVEADSLDSPLDIMLEADYNKLPVRLSGTTGSLKNFTENKSYKFDLAAELGKIKATALGQLDQPKVLTGLNIDLTLKFDSLQDLTMLINKELPDIGGPVDIQASLADQDGSYMLKSLTANFDNVSMQAEGEIANASKLEGIKIKFAVNAPSISDLNKLIGSQLPKLGPLSLSGTAADNKGGYQLSDINFKLATTNLEGSAAINLAGNRPALTSTLNSTMVDLTPFVSGKKSEKKAKKTRLFPNDSLPFALFKKADTNLNLSISKVKHPELDLEDVKLGINLNNGKLHIKPLDLKVAEGIAALNFDLDTGSGKTAMFAMKGKVNGFAASRLQYLQGRLTGGNMDIDIDIKGQGESVAEIMSVLNGKLLVQMGEGTLKSSAGDNDDTKSPLLMVFNNIYSGSAGSDSQTQIQCGVFNASIVDGIATMDKSIAFNTKYMNIVGSGQINLKTEEINIGIDPQAREGSGLSVGQLAELVRIKGTLLEPKAAPDTVAALKSAASVGAAVMTGGLSILAQGLFDRVTSDDDPCATALGIIKDKSPNQTQKQNAATATEESTKQKVGGDSIQDRLRGMFN